MTWNKFHVTGIRNEFRVTGNKAIVLMRTTHYKRFLPHIQPIGATFFVTTRLAGTLPKSVLKELRNKYKERTAALKLEKLPNWKLEVYMEGKRYFREYDDYLDKANCSIRYLAQPEVAKIVIQQLERFNGEWYDLIAYCIMPNHIHLVLDLSIQIAPFTMEEDVLETEYQELKTIMKRIKGASGRYANQFLGRTGQAFWQVESYDHYTRGERELGNVIQYTLNNPVKAKLVESWEAHPFTWSKFS